MNDLISNPEPTMSSREIADLKKQVEFLQEQVRALQEQVMQIMINNVNRY